MVTPEQLQKVGIPGLLLIAIGFLYSELREAKAEIRALNQRHDDFVQMIIARYHIPLTQ